LGAHAQYSRGDNGDAAMSIWGGKTASILGYVPNKSYFFESTSDGYSGNQGSQSVARSRLA